MEQQKVRFEQMKNELMAANAKLPIEVNVYGRVSYSHIRTIIEGEELAKQIERQKQMGLKNPETKNHYSITINSGVKVEESPEIPAVVSEYLKGKIGSRGSFSMISKSNNPPLFMMGKGLEPLTYTNEQGVTAIVENAGQLPAELGKGLLVCLGISVFGSKNGMGVGLEYVVALEPIRYMAGGNINTSAVLEKIGVVNPKDFPEEAPVGTPDTAPQAAAPMAGAQAPVPNAYGQGYQQPQPAQQAPMNGQPAGQPYEQEYGQPQQQATAYGQPQQPQQAGPFMNPPAGDPFYGQPQQGGITYQPQ